MVPNFLLELTSRQTCHHPRYFCYLMYAGLVATPKTTCSDSRFGDTLNERVTKRLSYFPPPRLNTNLDNFLNDTYDVYPTCPNSRMCPFIETRVHAVLAIGRLAAEDVIPMWAHHYFLFIFFSVRVHTGLYVTNIKPVRDVLRERVVRGGDGGGRKVPMFPFGLCEKNYGSGSSKVAIGMFERDSTARSSQSSAGSNDNSWLGMGRLQHIMDSPPLLQAFEELCLRALCFEVRSNRSTCETR